MSHPYIDIYVLTDKRDQQTIDEFLHDFTNRAEIEDRGDEELMILDNATLLTGKQYTWQKAKTLTNAIAIGLSRQDISFSLLLLPNRKELEWVTITFTIDNKLVLGLSVFEYQDDQETLDNYQLAESLRDEMFDKYEGRLAVIGLEIDFPISEQEFLELKTIRKS